MPFEGLHCRGPEQTAKKLTLTPFLINSDPFFGLAIQKTGRLVGTAFRHRR
jgi:hypothetical protein